MFKVIEDVRMFRICFNEKNSDSLEHFLFWLNPKIPHSKTLQKLLFTDMQKVPEPEPESLETSQMYLSTRNHARVNKILLKGKNKQTKVLPVSTC